MCSSVRGSGRVYLGYSGSRSRPPDVDSKKPGFMLRPGLCSPSLKPCPEGLGLSPGDETPFFPGSIDESQGIFGTVEGVCAWYPKVKKALRHTRA